MGAARRRYKAQRQAAFWAERQGREISSSITVSLPMAFSFPAGSRRVFWAPVGTEPFPALRGVEQHIREATSAVARMVDQHVEQMLGELHEPRTPSAFTRVNVGKEHPGANFPIHHTLGLSGDESHGGDSVHERAESGSDRRTEDEEGA